MLIFLSKTIKIHTEKFGDVVFRFKFVHQVVWVSFVMLCSVEKEWQWSTKAGAEGALSWTSG
jgi:hypothetical protein